MFTTLVCDPQLVQALLARKADLLPLLQAPTEADEREQFEERAAIAEFEGGLPRAKAERTAVAELARRRLPAELLTCFLATRAVLLLLPTQRNPRDDPAQVGTDCMGVANFSGSEGGNWVKEGIWFLGPLNKDVL